MRPVEPSTDLYSLTQVGWGHPRTGQGSGITNAGSPLLVPQGKAIASRASNLLHFFELILN